jgi:nucleoside-diphosphate-sugar epimerase
LWQETAKEARREPEADLPSRVIEVNVMGTVALLDWARSQRLSRFIYVSSGSVYRDHGPDRPGEPLPEDGYVMPRQLYGISKFTSELIVARYGQLFGLPVASVRLSSVYGTMDRATATRTYRHVPNQIAHMALAGVKYVRVNSLCGVGDYVHAEDAARAIAALLSSSELRYGVYNIAAGETTTLGEFVLWAAEKVPGFRAEEVAPTEADIFQDPALRDGAWGAYDISRIFADTGWKPRGRRDAFHAYMDWLAGCCPQK